MRGVSVVAAMVVVMTTGVLFAGGLDRAESWDRDRAAHLLRRAGFGGTPDEIERLVTLGLNAAVSRLVDFESTAQTDPGFAVSTLPAPKQVFRAIPDLSQEQRKTTRQHIRVVNRAEIAALRAWWLRRMVVSPRPFEEKMTLFWHGHFTTGAQEVRVSRLLAGQNELLRRHAVDPFRVMLSAICRDPAMLRYLDNASNRKQHPNENFARELLELFTMGAGNYTEEDVREAARALTGWTFDRNGFRFRKGWHDFGPKAFLGREGRFDGDDVIDIILSRPETAGHIAGRILRFFVSDDPGEEFVAALAERLRETDYDIRDCMRAIFSSEVFYASDVRFEHIKSPVELAVSTARALGLRDCDYYGMADATRRMGQDLFQPPNVKGWGGGRSWISSSTLFARQGFAGAVAAGGPKNPFERRTKRWDEVVSIRKSLREAVPPRVPLALAPPQVELSRQPPLDVAKLLGGKKRWTVGEAVDHFALTLLHHPLEAHQRDELIGMLGSANDVVNFHKPRTVQQLRTLIRAIMTLPAFQLS